MTLEQLSHLRRGGRKSSMLRSRKPTDLTQSAPARRSRAGGAVRDQAVDRIGRGIVLTQTGRDFLNEAREGCGARQGGGRSWMILAGLKRGSLTLAASQDRRNYWLPPRIAAFRKAHRASICTSRSQTRASRPACPSRRCRPSVSSRARLTIPTAHPGKMEGDSLAIVVGGDHPWIGKARIHAKASDPRHAGFCENQAPAPPPCSSCAQEARHEAIGLDLPA